jgi:hypothetical protein
MKCKQFFRELKDIWVALWPKTDFETLYIGRVDVKVGEFPSEHVLPELFQTIETWLKEGKTVYLRQWQGQIPNVYENPPRNYRIMLSEHPESHKPQLVYFETTDCGTSGKPDQSPQSYLLNLDYYSYPKKMTNK